MCTGPAHGQAGVLPGGGGLPRAHGGTSESAARYVGQQLPALLVKAMRPPQLRCACWPGLAGGVRLAARSGSRHEVARSAASRSRGRKPGVGYRQDRTPRRSAAPTMSGQVTPPCRGESGDRLSTRSWQADTRQVMRVCRRRQDGSRAELTGDGPVRWGVTHRQGSKPRPHARREGRSGDATGLRRRTGLAS